MLGMPVIITIMLRCSPAADTQLNCCSLVSRVFQARALNFVPLLLFLSRVCVLAEDCHLKGDCCVALQASVSSKLEEADPGVQAGGDRRQVCYAFLRHCCQVSHPSYMQSKANTLISMSGKTTQHCLVGCLIEKLCSLLWTGSSFPQYVCTVRPSRNRVSGAQLAVGQNTAGDPVLLDTVTYD